jgi:hypothetical protein
MSLEKDKSFSKGDPVVDALVDAVGLLAARVDGLEHQFAAFIGVLDLPLSPAEALSELRKLREELWAGESAGRFSQRGSTTPSGNV